MRMTEAMEALGEPYPGLRSFRRDETHIFFGRENTISEMVDRLAEHHFLAVTGISGSASRRWCAPACSTRSTAAPGRRRLGLVRRRFPSRRTALSRLTLTLVKALIDFFRRGARVDRGQAGKRSVGPGHMADEIASAAKSTSSCWSISSRRFSVIAGTDRRRHRRLRGIAARERQAAQAAHLCVITMRSDFLGDCARFADLAETINDGQFLTRG